MNEKELGMICDKCGNNILIEPAKMDSDVRVFISHAAFNEALIYLKRGYRIRRKGWRIFLENNNTEDIITVSDLIANDWEILRND